MIGNLRAIIDALGDEMETHPLDPNFMDSGRKQLIEKLEVKCSARRVRRNLKRLRNHNRTIHGQTTPEWQKKTMLKIDKRIDKTFPPRGACSTCGDPDARHYTFEHIQKGWKKGVSVEELAAEYQVPTSAIELIIAPVKLI